MLLSSLWTGVTRIAPSCMLSSAIILLQIGLLPNKKQKFHCDLEIWCFIYVYLDLLTSEKVSFPLLLSYYKLKVYVLPKQTLIWIINFIIWAAKFIWLNLFIVIFKVSFGVSGSKISLRNSNNSLRTESVKSTENYKS